MELALFARPDDEVRGYPHDDESHERHRIRKNSPTPNYRQRHNNRAEGQKHRPERPKQNATKIVASPLDLSPAKLETGAVTRISRHRRRPISSGQEIHTGEAPGKRERE